MFHLSFSHTHTLSRNIHYFPKAHSSASWYNADNDTMQTLAKNARQQEIKPPSPNAGNLQNLGTPRFLSWQSLNSQSFKIPPSDNSDARQMGTDHASSYAMDSQLPEAVNSWPTWKIMVLEVKSSHMSWMAIDIWSECQTMLFQTSHNTQN